MRKHDRFQQDEGEEQSLHKQLKQPITISGKLRFGADFKSLAEELGMPYQKVLSTSI